MTLSISMSELLGTLSDSVLFSDKTRGLCLTLPSSVTKLKGLCLTLSSSMRELGGLCLTLLQWQNPGDSLWHCLLEWQNSRDTVFFGDRIRGTLTLCLVTKLGGLGLALSSSVTKLRGHCLLHWQNSGTLSDTVFFSDRTRGTLTLSSVTKLGGLYLVFGVIGWAPMWTFDYVLPTEISRGMIKLWHIAEEKVVS